MIQKLSFINFKGKYDSNLDNYTYHAKVQFTERGFKGKWVERVIEDPKKIGVHIKHYKEPDKTIHLGISGPGDELFAVITNEIGKVITLFRDPLISRLELFQKHYPDLDLFNLLKIKK